MKYYYGLTTELKESYTYLDFNFICTTNQKFKCDHIYKLNGLEYFIIRLYHIAFQLDDELRIRDANNYNNIISIFEKEYESYSNNSEVLYKKIK